MVTRSVFSKFRHYLHKLSISNKQVDNSDRDIGEMIKIIAAADKNAEITHEFLALHNIYRKYSMTFDRQSEYYAFIEKICDSVKSLEGKLVQIYKKRISNYFSKKWTLMLKGILSV